ncbi:MAG: endonuclease/exonuclease/phosphatase family protein [Actinobacteria bacterium]|nr:endonuclease/exonuclease/phosphatase family protein [Actinomycetota bacterium]
MQLTVLTINVWGTNPPRDERMAGLVRYLRSHRPDVVGLQEVDDLDGRSQAHRIAEEVGYATVAHHRVVGRDGELGEALSLLTDLPGQERAAVTLPGVSDDPRALQLIEIVLGDGGNILVGNTHLTWPLDATDVRVQQAKRIREEFASWTGPAILLGDLNDVPGSPTLRVLTEPHEAFEPLVDCYARRHGGDGEEEWTFHPDNPYVWQPSLLRRRVDHILVRGLKVVDAAVVLRGDDAPIVSDHFGVRAILDVHG